MNKRELIENTAAFYNTKNWAAIEGPNSWECKYETEDGKNCAVGRWMTLEAKEKYKSPYCGGITDVITDSIRDRAFYLADRPERNKTLDSLLVEEVRGHDYEFWQELQGFHDNDLHWSEDGINKYGVQAKEVLLAKWGEPEQETQPE